MYGKPLSGDENDDESKSRKNHQRPSGSDAGRRRSEQAVPPGPAVHRAAEQIGLTHSGHRSREDPGRRNGADQNGLFGDRRFLLETTVQHCVVDLLRHSIACAL